MEKLMIILAKGEIPDFSQMMEALNDISDIDWDRLEASQMTITDVLKTGGIPKYPQIRCSQFCESCG